MSSGEEISTNFCVFQSLQISDGCSVTRFLCHWFWSQKARVCGTRIGSLLV